VASADSARSMLKSDGPSAVNVSTIPDLHDDDDQPLVLDPVVARADPRMSLKQPAFHGLASGRPGVLGERLNSLVDLFADRFRRVRSQKAVTRNRSEVKVFHQAAAEPR
jgi:hypothetical protein